MKIKNEAGLSVKFQVLTEEQKQQVHGAVMETLQDVGVEVRSAPALETLKKAGASVYESRVRMPEKLVEEALKTVPRGFSLYDRTGSGKRNFEGKEFNFGPGPSTTYTIDPYSGERRLPRKQDTRNAARVMDAMEHIDFVMDFGTIQDVPTRYADLHLLQAILENTSKPIVHWGFDAANCKTIIEICAAIAGSKEELQKYPFLAFFACSNSPLLHSRESLEKMAFIAESNIPLVYVAAPTAGATTPVSLAGTLVVTLAEGLSGLVMHQLAREGAPYAIGGVTGATDMHTLSMSYGCPEFNLMHAGLTEMAHFYNLPLWGTAGCTDSKVVDQQAAVEATASIMMSAMSGTNMIHDVGYIEGGNCSNLAMLVMCDEIIGYVKRLVRGVRVDDVALALDAIKRVGPMGEYITDPHTYENFKTELWFPKIMDRHPCQRWLADGSLTMGDKAHARARELIENHRPEPLEEKVRNKINKILSDLV